MHKVGWVSWLEVDIGAMDSLIMKEREREEERYTVRRIYMTPKNFFDISRVVSTVLACLETI